MQLSVKGPIIGCPQTLYWETDPTFMEGHELSVEICVCRSVDAALRRSIPAFNKDVKNIQARLEDIAFKLRIPQRKPWQGMADNVAASIALAQQPDKVSLLGRLANVCGCSSSTAHLACLSAPHDRSEALHYCG